MKKTLLALSLFATFAVSAQTDPIFHWSKTAGGVGFDSAYGVISDADGNVYSVGTFNYTVDFNPGTATFNLTQEGILADTFVQKYDANGNFVWAKKIGGNSSNAFFKIAFSTNGDLILGGSFNGTVDFDPNATTFNLTSVPLPDPTFPSTDVVVARLTKDGNFVWAKKVGGAGYEEIHDMRVDAQGNILVSGFFELTCDFDPGTPNYPLTASGSRDGFILKLDANGNFAWAKRFGGASETRVTQAAFDANGNVYAVGNFFNAIDVDPGAGQILLTPSAPDSFNQYSQDVFVVKLNASGEYQWAGKIGGTMADACYALELDSNANVYLSGWFYGNSDMDPSANENILSSTGASAFLSKISTGGQLQWTRQMPAGSAPNVTRILKHPDGSLLMAGTFTQSLSLSPSVSINGFGDTDLFLAKFDAEGNALWAQAFGGAGSDNLTDFSVGANNTWHFVGNFAGTSNMNPFATDHHTVVGFQDFFVTRLAPEALGAPEFSVDHAWTAYPNPSNGNVNLHFDDALIGAKVGVFTLLGQNVSEFEVAQSDEKLLLQSGTYLVKVFGSEFASVKKLLVK